MDIGILFSEETLLIVGCSLVFGYLILLILLFFLPKKLKAENLQQKEILVQRAYQKRSQIIMESKTRYEEQFQLNREELETSLADRELDLRVAAAELDSQENSVKQTEQRILRRERDITTHQNKVNSLKARHDTENNKVLAAKIELQTKLEQLAQCQSSQILSGLVDSIMSERQLEAQRTLKDKIDYLGTHAKREATRVLNRSLSRYSPNFNWPKPTSHVEIPNNKILEALQSPRYELLSQLGELSEGVEISLVLDDKENNAHTVKLGGGYGLFKEAVHLTLEEVFSKGPSQWGKIDKIYERHRATLEALAFKLGRQIVKDLNIDDTHEELQKMIGALNWRSSYRQNQYYHSFEVACLAGILARELGVDPKVATRCGLLHDIGKGIDYRIEGSHAIISADYADRYGESLLICETIMSHHNDLVLETPLANILKTADTLSGARPGARVHLEEGYQIRLSAIDQVVKSFPGILKVAIMSGGREVHIEVNHKRVREEEVSDLTKKIIKKIEEDVVYPGQIKVMLTRRFEAIALT